MRIIKTLLMIAIIIVSANKSNAQEYTQFFEDGINAAAQGNYKDAITLWEKGASVNDKYCYGRLAAAYLYGLGVTVDYNKAREYGEKGYKLGNSYASAICAYSIIFEYGMESEIGLKKAMPYLIYSYNADDRESDNVDLYGNIGLTIYSAFFNEGKEDEGHKWLERVVADFPESPSVLGWAAYTYWAFNNYDKAVPLATKADKNDNLQGTFVLGWCMAYGHGIIQNEIGGFKKIRKVAMIAGSGIDYAMYSLAECYYNGIGTEIDKVKAKEWYQKAADAGVPEAKEKLEILFD